MRDDGLFVSQVFEHPSRGNNGPHIFYVEFLAGQMVQPTGSKKIYILAGDQDCRVSEVIGLDTVKDLEGGVYSHTPELAAQATQAWAAHQAQIASGQPLVLARGGASGLAVADPVGKSVDEKHAFQVQASYDATNLYFRYTVTSPAQLVNGVVDPLTIFRGGNLLDIQIGADPKADPKRTKPAPGDVRLLISQRDGKPWAVMLRPKVAGFTGAHRELWDGLDEQGKPAPAGGYTWKLLATPGLRAEYLLSLGNNYPEYPDGVRDWRHRAPGTHGGPTAVAFGPSGVYVAASCTENIENYLVAMTPDGKERRWSALQHVAWKGGTAMALDGDTLYVLGANQEIWPYAVANGKLGGALKLAVDGELPSGLAAHKGILALCYSKQNVVAWADPTQKTLLERVAVAGVVDVALTAAGEILALTRDTVLRVPRGGPPTPLITGLTEAHRLAVDPTSGEVLIAECGAGQQVKRFAVDGKRLNVYGRLGGRQDGRYVPADFRNIGDIAADGQGGFLVTEPEAAPRRTAHFTREGQLMGLLFLSRSGGWRVLRRL